MNPETEQTSENIETVETVDVSDIEETAVEEVLASASYADDDSQGEDLPEVNFEELESDPNVTDEEPDQTEQPTDDQDFADGTVVVEDAVDPDYQHLIELQQTLVDLDYRTPEYRKLSIDVRDTLQRLKDKATDPQEQAALTEALSSVEQFLDVDWTLTAPELDVPAIEGADIPTLDLKASAYTDEDENPTMFLTSMVASPLDGGECLPCKARQGNRPRPQDQQEPAAAPDPGPEVFSAPSVLAFDEIETDVLEAFAEQDAQEEVRTEFAPGDKVFWRGVIGVEGIPTGDGRLIEQGALKWQDLPLPLRYVESDQGAHTGAQVVGTITDIVREDGNLVGYGMFDTGSAVGCEAARKVALSLSSGISMDLDNVVFEIRGGDNTQSDHSVQLSNDEMTVTTEGRIRAATLVAIPAFAEAKIEVIPEEEYSKRPQEATAEYALEQLAEDECEECVEQAPDAYNWVDKVGGLPKYIRKIADELVKKGFTESRAIATAVNTVKRWARGGSTTKHGGKSHVNPKTVAKAQAALAEWEAKKARAHLSGDVAGYGLQPSPSRVSRQEVLRGFLGELEGQELVEEAHPLATSLVEQLGVVDEDSTQAVVALASLAALTVGEPINEAVLTTIGRLTNTVPA